MKLSGICLLFIFFGGSLPAQTIRQLIDSANFYKLKNYNKSIDFATRANVLANKTKQVGLAGESSMVSGASSYLNGDLNSALKSYFESEKSFLQVKDPKGLSGLYAEMCIIYIKLKQYSTAHTMATKSIENGRLAADSTIVATAINNNGLVFLEEKKSDSALLSFQASYKIYNKMHDKLGMAYCLDYLASVLAEKGNYEQALANMNSSKQLREGVGDRTGEAIAINNIGELYLQEKKPSLAIPYFREAIRKADSLHYVDLEVNSYKLLAQCEQQTGYYQAAYKDQQTYISLNQKLQDEKKAKDIDELQTRYETNKKEQQIVYLHEQNLIQQLQISKKNYTIMIIAIILFLIILIAYQSYSRNRIRHESLLKTAIITQQKIASQNIIDAEENERKRIAEDLHDGIGQLFTTVKMNLEILVERFMVQKPDAASLAQKTLGLVDESCTEVRSIAHQMMPNALIKNGLVLALKDFINKIPSDKIHITLETEGVRSRMSASLETVLYRVIQESVNNVFKHAQASKLDVILLSDEKEITVTIEDNGKGFDTADTKNFEGIGLKNIQRRIEYLNGSVEISSSLGRGTIVAIHIPLT